MTAAPGMNFCPRCDRLFDNYNAVIDRGGSNAEALAALEAYDAHREQRHPRLGYT